MSRSASTSLHLVNIRWMLRHPRSGSLSTSWKVARLRSPQRYSNLFLVYSLGSSFLGLQRLDFLGTAVRSGGCFGRSWVTFIKLVCFLVLLQGNGCTGVLHRRRIVSPVISY